MNIILVSRRRKTPLSLDLGQRKTLFRTTGVMLAVVAILMTAGAALALLIASPKNSALAEIDHLQGRVDKQAEQLVAVRAEAQRQVNALAVSLGKLKAQSMRINAVGQRLTKMGGLDDGEFDFDSNPGVGGPESPDGSGWLLPGNLDASIAELANRFDRQQEQLLVLQDLLIDHEVASKQRPTGMPVHSGYISSYYGNRIDPFDGSSTFHRGIDFAARRGTPVHSVAEGVVTYAGRRSGYGKVVEIDHGNGYTTRYAHNSKILVHVGEHVKVDQKIALVGSTGHSTGPHSHFEVWFHGQSVNPLAYVRSHRG